VLKDFPKEYIYEPWTAPLTLQKKANCIIGVDYPKPIVDHKEVSKINMGRMKLYFGQEESKTDNQKLQTSKKIFQ